VKFAAAMPDGRILIRLSGSLVFARTHHVGLDIGVVRRMRGTLILVEFVGIDPAATVEGFVLRGHHAAAEKNDGEGKGLLICVMRVSVGRASGGRGGRIGARWRVDGV